MQNQSSASQLLLFDLTAKISKVDMNGEFQVNFSEKIYQLRKESLLAKNTIQVKVIWMNEKILSQKMVKPPY